MNEDTENLAKTWKWGSINQDPRVFTGLHSPLEDKIQGLFSLSYP